MLAALLLLLAFRQEPGDARAFLEQAQAAAQRKDTAAALAAAQKAEALGAEDAALLQALANLYAGPLADPAKAASLGARYAARAPSDKTAWRRLAAYCLATGQPDCAVDAGARGLSTDDSAQMHALLGRAYTERKEWDKAAAELTRAVQLDPYTEDNHFRLAQLYLLRQDFPAAAAVLENARKFFDRSPQIELALGVAYYGLRAFPKAVDQFLRTIQLSPDVPQPYVFLGRMLEHAEGRLPEVTARFAAFQARHPDDPLGYVLHAKALVARLPPSGYPPEAQTAFGLVEKALALNQDLAEPHYLAGLLLERKGDLAAATTHLERSIALDPKDAAAHYRLARVYARLGRAADSARERALHEKLSEEEGSAGQRGKPLPPAK